MVDSTIRLTTVDLILTTYLTSLMSDILNLKLQSYRSQINEIVKDLHHLTIGIGHQELAKTISDLRNRINEPFMFVIVGEVKAGKSSFINALLGAEKEIAKVAPQPMTDTIQQIIYGEKEELISINPYLKKITQSIDILKEIAIVDTPGTNTIVEHHQEITERFIPASDLIVFVFEAKNPYRQSSWDFFDYIHTEWRKKIIFVLQQKDLVAPDALEVNTKGVVEYAQKKGIPQPQVFVVSAKQELEGQTEESGFESVKNYIQDNITGGKAPILKLKNNIEISKNINERIYKGLLLRKKQWNADIEFREDIRHTLSKQEVRSNNQVDVLLENLLNAYDKIANKKEEELQEGLSFFALLRRSIASIFTKKASAKDWLEGLVKEMERDLDQAMRSRLDTGVVDLAESIQQMAKIIHLKLQNSQTILRNNHEIFSNIAERRSNVLMDLQKAFANFMSRSENFADKELFPDTKNLSPNIATGSGIAVIGVILATVTNGMVFDITGGILTTIGLLFAGVSSSVKKRKILEGFHTEIAKGRLRMEEEVGSKLKAYIEHIKEKIDDNFDDFDHHLKTEEEQIQVLEQKHLTIHNRLGTIERELA